MDARSVFDWLAGAALSALLLPAPAAAGDDPVRIIDAGEYGKREQITVRENYAAWGGTNATLTANEDGSYQLTIYNVLAPSPHEFTVRMVLDGYEITLWVSNGEGDTPDTYTVLPPDGWTGVPAEITVEEKESGTIRIVPMLLG